MSDNQNNSVNESGKSPLKVILLIAAVLIVAGVAYLLVNRLSLPTAGEGEMPAAIEQALDEANPFPETEALNLPPQDEMVNDGTVSSTDATTAANVDVAKVMGPRGLGDPNAPVKLVEFFSLTCSHCANFHNITLPQIKEYIDRGEVYLEFHEFPLNAPALRASMVARCLPEDKYYGYISLLFKTQDTWTTNPDYMTALRQNAKLAGMSDESFDACVANNALQLAIGEQMQEATSKWQIESTPTFIVNGGQDKISGAQPAYEFERVFRAVSGGKVAPLMADKNKEDAATDNATETAPETDAVPEATEEPATETQTE